MWNGKKKAITFSFDDGVLQDIRLIEILNKYNLKCTFNLNAGLLGTLNSLNIRNQTIRHDKVTPDKVKEIYSGHEVACHTLTHPTLIRISDETVIWQLQQDKKLLESLVGYEIHGMAYPGGNPNHDERVMKLIRENTSLKYARTVDSTFSFDIPEDLLALNPTTSYVYTDRLFPLAEKFLNLTPDKPQMFYIWGHAYEMDAGLISWERFEEFCKMISGKDDIFYGTNSEVLKELW